jgi:hypothetical protein
MIVSQICVFEARCYCLSVVVVFPSDETTDPGLAREEWFPGDSRHVQAAGKSTVAFFFQVLQSDGVGKSDKAFWVWASVARVIGSFPAYGVVTIGIAATGATGRAFGWQPELVSVQYRLYKVMIERLVRVHAVAECCRVPGSIE